MLLKYNLRETARYMGYRRSAEPNEVVRELIEEAYQELLKVIAPKYIYKQYDFAPTADGIMIEGVEFKSKNLLTHLRDSNAVILFAATLGKGADDLIASYSKSDVAMAAVAQAVSGSLVENLCDLAIEEIKIQIKGVFRPRFSPGYGDCSLSHQTLFFNLLPVNKELSISLTESFMMTPTKTVTAFIGLKK